MGWTLAYVCARAGGVKRCEAAVLISHEAVIHRTPVDVISRDRPHWVDALGERALAGSYARAWNIEGGDGAFSGTHIPVINATPVN